MSNEVAAQIAELVAAQVGDELRALTVAFDEHPLALKPGQLWATAEQLAHRYSFRDADTIRRRSVEFGGASLHDGPGADLRYHVPSADAYWHARQRKLTEQCRAPAITPRAPRRPKRRPTLSPAGHPLVEF